MTRLAAWASRPRRIHEWAELVVTGVILAASTLFVLIALHPSKLLSNTTPAGGDMGAHVWAPAFLKSHLLPHGRISGWAPAWYDGFPALTFYFPGPYVAIALLSYVLPYGIAFKLVSVSGVVGLPLAAYAFGRLMGMKFPGPLLMAVATVPFLFDRYFTIWGGNIASTLAGEFAFSISLCLALVFIGVFAKSMETGRYRWLAAALLAGTLFCHLLPTFFAIAGAVIVWLLQPSRRRLGTAVLIGAVGMALTAWWLLPFAVRLGYSNDMGWERTTSYMKGLFPFLCNAHKTDTSINCPSFSVVHAYTVHLKVVVALAAAAVIGGLAMRRRATLVIVGLGALSAAAFRLLPQGTLWNARMLPFWYLSLYLAAAACVAESALAVGVLLGRAPRAPAVVDGDPGEDDPHPVPPEVGADRQLVGAGVAAAPVGASPAGPGPGAPGGATAGAPGGATAGVGPGQGALAGGKAWGSLSEAGYRPAATEAPAGASTAPSRTSVSEILPASEAEGAPSRRLPTPPWPPGGRPGPREPGAGEPGAEVVDVVPNRWPAIVISVLVTLLVLAFVGQSVPDYAGVTSFFLHNASIGGADQRANPNFVSSWANWNYSGYQKKAAYPEFSDVMATMAKVGRQDGCGRALWEYEPEEDRFGTPMALMLLPMWTNGCIDSEEGLFFESSATVPYHFLNQSELSETPSRAMRGLPYRNFDIADGIAHLRMLGVRYYMAISPGAQAAAEALARGADPQLKLVASTRPHQVQYTSGSATTSQARTWQVYEVAGSDQVAPLAYLPAVMKGVPTTGPGWNDVSIAWYQDQSRWDVPLAASGPSNWPRVEGAPRNPPRIPVRQAVVSHVVTTDDRISFDVDRPGTPVVVKTSYFPNWQAIGAKGPFRVTPNLMVVVPTRRHVELHYGFTPVDNAGRLLSFAALAVTGGLWWQDRQVDAGAGSGGGTVPGPAAGGPMGVADDDADDDPRSDGHAAAHPGSDGHAAAHPGSDGHAAAHPGSDGHTASDRAGPTERPAGDGGRATGYEAAGSAYP